MGAARTAPRPLVDASVLIETAPPAIDVIGVGAGLLGWNDTLSITTRDETLTLRLAPTPAFR